MKIISILVAIVLGSAAQAEVKPPYVLLPSLCGVNVNEFAPAGVPPIAGGPVWAESVCLEHVNAQNGVSVITISYTDGSTEYLPVLAREGKPSAADRQVTVLKAYLGGAKKGGRYTLLNTTDIVLSRNLTRPNSGPGTLSGKGSKGTGFRVELQHVIMTESVQ